MKKILIAAVAASSIGLAGCTTDQGFFGGAAAGGLIGAGLTHSWAGAALFAGVGALAGAALVEHDNGMCVYKYKHKYYKDYC